MMIDIIIKMDLVRRKWKAWSSMDNWHRIQGRSLPHGYHLVNQQELLEHVFSVGILFFAWISLTPSPQAKRS